MKSNMISGHVGIFLRKARKEKNMTGKQLARLMNVSQQQISRYEIGATAITVDQLANFLLILDKKWVDVFKYLENEFSDEREINKVDNKRNIFYGKVVKQKTS
ncbi:helix-turn-helix domain-containing protein [Proteus mirabilis]